MKKLFLMAICSCVMVCSCSKAKEGVKSEESKPTEDVGNAKPEELKPDMEEISNVSDADVIDMPDGSEFGLDETVGDAGLEMEDYEFGNEGFGEPMEPEEPEEPSIDDAYSDFYGMEMDDDVYGTKHTEQAAPKVSENTASKPSASRAKKEEADNSTYNGLVYYTESPKASRYHIKENCRALRNGVEMSPQYEVKKAPASTARAAGKKQCWKCFK